MDHHDVARLGDEDFEQVCKDLFEEILGIQLEVFARGADDGVDLRGIDADGGTVVVQCKHWWRSPGAALARHVEQVELAKVQALSPARYVLATSCDLTVRMKDRLYGLLQPFARTPADVYGVKEIAAELRKRPHVVRRHPALWFHGSEVLSALLNKKLFERSRDLVAEMKASLRVFVPGFRYLEASRILQAHHVCLVSGQPGYGKTTLAHALAATYAARGFRIVAVTEETDLDEAWDDDEPQFFIYDDFLGSTSVERRRYAGATRLLQLMKKVRDAPDKRLVLTTREYVLAEARDRHESLHDAGIDVLKCSIELDEYDGAMRTEIVRRHVMQSALPEHAKAAVTDAGVLGKIAWHPHFNPRVVAMAIGAAAHRLTSPDDLVADLLRQLDDPKGLWWHVVENQLDDAEVDLLAVLLSLDRQTPLDVVERAWAAFRRHEGRAVDRRAFHRAVRALNGTMVLTGRPAGVVIGETWIQFHNPSVVDFAAAYFLADRGVVTALLDSAVFFRQVEALWDSLCPFGVEVPPSLTALAQVFEGAVRRTFGTLISDPLSDSPFFRATVVAEMTAKLRSDDLRAFLRESLGGLYVSFEIGVDEADVGGLGLLVGELVEWPDLAPELCDLLVPAIEAIDEGDIDEVYALAEFLKQFDVPAPISDATDRKVVAVVERALAGPLPLDDDTMWSLGMTVSRRRLEVPGIPSEWLVDEVDDPR